MKYSAPFKACTKNSVSQGWSKDHQALDVVKFDEVKGRNTPLCAPESGRIIAIRGDKFSRDTDALAEGYAVFMRGSESGNVHMFLHTLPTFPVNVGDKVSRGQIVAFMGNSGRVYEGGVYVPIDKRLDTNDGTHLHWEVMKNYVRGRKIGLFNFTSDVDWELQPVYGTMELTVATLKAVAKANSMLNLFNRPVDTLFHPVQYLPRIISQRYGVLSQAYPRTGRHIGTDYSIPVGTPLHAPALGKVTAAGTGKATGNFCHFEYSFQGEVYEERWCHLREVPRLGTYARGAIVARSGNTGQSTGPHLHREVWRRDVRVDLINAENWDELTLDPEALI